jgi:pimeloyl-ACP methyl ester carboxylesterase
VARAYGHGAGKVWVITPRRGIARSVVVFVHGWTATSPFDWHQAWLDHLVARGSVVLFPVYQAGRPDDAFASTPRGLRAGLVAGFRALGSTRLPVVVVGYSVGGALAFEYAARAAAWHLPRPAAVMSVFPVDPLQVDPALLDLGPPKVPVLVLAGDRDEVVGEAGAKAFWRWLGPVARRLKTYRLLRSTNGFVFRHEALKALGDPIVRAAFWAPLDSLVAAAR